MLRIYLSGWLLGCLVTFIFPFFFFFWSKYDGYPCTYVRKWGLGKWGIKYRVGARIGSNRIGHGWVLDFGGCCFLGAEGGRDDEGGGGVGERGGRKVGGGFEGGKGVCWVCWVW